jgi:exodeoxyribonuclease-5
VCAFTGKAAHVLRSKGVERAQTIHSLIYRPEEVVTAVPRSCPDGTTAFTTATRVVYHLRDELDAGVDGVLVDEASMVSGKLHADLCSFGLPLVFVGDHGQLEPVGDDPGLMRAPDFKLETVHRNANEIAHFAGHVRRGNWASSWRHVAGAGERVRFFEPGRVVDHMRRADQTIVAFNARRVGLNAAYRAEALGRVGDRPEVGDRLIVLRNTRRLRIFNGQQVTALDVASGTMRVRTDDDRVLSLDYTGAAFNKARPDIDPSPDGPVPLDFAYAVTAHKAQGSEWGTGVVVEQWCPHWEHQRWAYTAATRFRDRVYWTNPKWN